jgi:uncharacterized membrane protein YhaH (DUF805 family)
MSRQYQPSLRSWFTASAEERAANRWLMFSFEGRVPRQPYWIFAFLPANIFVVLAAAFDLPARMGAFGFTVFCLLIGWVFLAVSVKRCHDRGRSGWFVLVPLIPVIGAIWTIVELGMLAGTRGDNRYGPDPLG